MGCFYSVVAEIPIATMKLTVREVADAIKTLNDNHQESEASRYEDGILKVSCEGHMSDGAAEDVDKALRIIGSHANRASIVEYIHETQHSFYAIGPDHDGIARAEAAEALKQIGSELQLLILSHGHGLPRKGESIQTVIDTIDAIKNEIEGK